MNHLERFKEIESKDGLAELMSFGHQVWPVVRNKYWAQLLSQVSGAKSSSKRDFRLLKNVAYGFRSFFRTYEYIFFSAPDNRKLINGKYYDRFTDPIADLVGQNHTCTVELTNGTHYSPSLTHSKHVVSHIGIKIIGLIISKFISINNHPVLDTIGIEYGIQINYKQVMKEFIANYWLMIILYKLWKPKQIYVVCYYTYLDVIAAAHKLGIPVIELQHGIIGNQHPAYNSNLLLKKKYFPDFIFAFGQFDKEILLKSVLFSHVKILVLGSWLLEYSLKKNSYSEIKNLREKYLNGEFKKIILITSQETIEEKLISFVKEVSIVTSEYLYLFLPRNYNDVYDQIFESYQNIIVPVNENFYTLMQIVDAHATVYSTCALEATKYDVLNILIDIDGMATKYFSNVLSVKQEVVYIENMMQFIDYVKTEKLKINSCSGDYFFHNDYLLNLSSALSILIEKEH